MTAATLSISWRLLPVLIPASVQRETHSGAENQDAEEQRAVEILPRSI